MCWFGFDHYLYSYIGCYCFHQTYKSRRAVLEIINDKALVQILQKLIIHQLKSKPSESAFVSLYFDGTDSQGAIKDLSPRAGGLLKLNSAPAGVMQEGSYIM